MGVNNLILVLIPATIWLLLVLQHGQTAANTHSLRPPATPRKSWWQLANATIYQIHPRSFADSNGDGIGDLKGIAARLDHLHKIKVNAIWLSSVFESPQKDFGNDISDFYDVHHGYGTMGDFERLVAQAARRNIRVLLDIVPNHSSDQHEWFRQSVTGVDEYRDYYVWKDGKKDRQGNRIPPNNWISVLGGSAWQWNAQRQQYYLHQFTVSQPDLNFRNSRVVAEMQNILTFWLGKGVAGFRLDGMNHLFEDMRFLDEPRNGTDMDPNSYDGLQHIYTKDVKETYDMIYEWRIMLDKWTNDHPGSETKILMTDQPNTMRLSESNDGRLGAHMPFNFQLIYVPKDASPPHSDTWLGNMPQGHTDKWAIGSHNHSRVATRMGTHLAPIMPTINQMRPGSSYNFSGDEIGMNDNNKYPMKDSRDACRTPMQWHNSTAAGLATNASTRTPINSNYRTSNVPTIRTPPRSNYPRYRELKELSRQQPVLINGNVDMKSLKQDLFAFIREHPVHSAYAFIVNLNVAKQQNNLETFVNLMNRTLTIAASVATSNYRIGNKIQALNLTVAGSDALVMRTTSGSKAIAFTILSTVLEIFVARFLLS